MVETNLSRVVERPNDHKLSDPAHEGVRLQPRRDGRVRCHEGFEWQLHKEPH